MWNNIQQEFFDLSADLKPHSAKSGDRGAVSGKKIELS